MKLPFFLHRPRHTSLLLLVLALLGLVLTPLAHASTFIGYSSSTTTCGGCNWPLANANYADGLAVVSPFAGQLVSVAIRTAIAPASAPTSIVIGTFPAGTNPGTTPSAGCNNACGFVNGGQSFTIQDIESVTISVPDIYQTVALAGPVTVSTGQWIAIMWMGQGTANNYLRLCSPCNNAGDPPITTAAGITLNIGSSSPTVGNSYSSVASNPGGGIIGGTFQPSGTTGQTITVTQCYGNCGSPAITLANTNSTHTTNFNQSITIFYEFQSNVNGFLLNVTTSLAKSYASSPNTPAFGVYTIPSCPSGVLPFSPQCPGQLQQTNGFFFNQPKGKVSFSGLKIPVSNGQWVAIALSAAFSGLDVNDTNTNVNLFQTNEGKIPPSIQQPQSLGNSKAGLWAWIIGNVVSGNGPSAPSGQFNCAGFLDCILPNLVFSFCANGTPNCLAMSGLVWAGILAVFSTFVVAKYGSELMPNAKIPFGEVFLFFILTWVFVMSGLSLTFVWIPLFFFFVVSILIGKQTGHYL